MTAPLLDIETETEAKHSLACETGQATTVNGRVTKFVPCTHAAVWRAFISCDGGHERTLLNCNDHYQKLIGGSQFCHVCNPASVVRMILGERIR